MIYISDLNGLQVWLDAGYAEQYIDYEVTINGMQAFTGRVFSPENALGCQINLQQILRAYAPDFLLVEGDGSEFPMSVAVVVNATAEDGTTSGWSDDVRFFEVPVDCSPVMPSGSEPFETANVERGGGVPVIADGDTIVPVSGEASEYNERDIPFYIENVGTSSINVGWGLGTSCTSAFETKMNGGGVEYSKDLQTWTAYSFTIGTYTPITLDEGERVYFRGNLNTGVNESSTTNTVSCLFASAVGQLVVGGNILSLCYATGFDTQDNMWNFSFCRFCSDNGNFRNSLKSAEFLWLPVTTAVYCYGFMFDRCPLEVAPVLRATNVANNAYYFLFRNALFDNVVALFEVLGTNALTGWLTGVGASGTLFYNENFDPSTLPAGDNGLPTGWTAEVYEGQDYVEYELTDGVVSESIFLKAGASQWVTTFAGVTDDVYLKKGTFSVLVAKVNECARYFLYWITRNNGVQSQAMNGKCLLGEGYERVSVEHYDGRVVAKRTNVGVRWSLNSGFISEDDARWYRDIFTSRNLLLYDRDMGKAFEVRITNSGWTEERVKDTRRLISMTFEVELTKEQVV